MVVLEQLYMMGVISYPRTETTIYNPTINLKEMVVGISQLQSDPATKEIGSYAQDLLKGIGFGGPRNGNKDDKSHPPIMPVKAVLPSFFTKDDNDIKKISVHCWDIYELIARHFLAQLSKDAVAEETTTNIQVRD